MAPMAKFWAGASLLGIVLFWNAPLLFKLSDDPPRFTRHNSTLSLLIWSWPFGAATDLTGDVCSRLYGITGCQLTTNRHLFNQVDVVVFHHWELQYERRDRLLSKAHPGQKWVWASLESPSNTKALEGWTGKEWNWVLSYRRDADLFFPYGELVPHSLEVVEIPEKTGLVCWVISNYHASQARAVMYHELSRHLRIDVFGKANRKLLCPDCLLPTISKYRFYLAFENSIHRDYITEKLWKNAFLAGSVPIVLGPSRANYEQFIPANSFIHVDDFSSAKDLATFLTTMNESHYRNFFAWKRNYTVRLHQDWRERFCSICQQYPHLPPNKLYPDLKRWYWDY
ncbi:alpha-(1,3)-fucosyltransferase 7 [Thamnophis elegans]|uniref:alpha-(1,3)-fucosyltransferase 7 n=1 Tax=Thamnophis elegans TaxID=35005 RepID=UPI0013764B3D|nr:alpha-(1,3)-fucosyltransferase 7 [Thamnophis elegans]